jgi:predicted ATP-grasp superfamily ATP-dependent carboligase
MRVLVVDGSTGQSHTALGAVRALAAAGHQVDLAHAGRWAMAARSRFVARRHRVPDADEPGFADAVRALLDSGHYGACFPTSDAALVALEWPGAHLVDKRVLQQRSEDADHPRPEGREFASGPELVRYAHELPFPVAVKAAAKAGEGAPSVWRADSAVDLHPAADVTAPVFAEEWLEGEQSAVCGVVQDGQLLAVVHQRYLRTWPVEVGNACAAVTTEPDLALEQRVVETLRGYDGIFQAEVIAGRLHDVNPRVYGSVVLAAHAGANLPDVAARLAAGEPLPDETVRARSGVRHRWVEGDLRHLAATWRSKDRTLREVVRALRPVRGTVHPDLLWSDPGPTLSRLRYAARRSGEEADR